LEEQLDGTGNGSAEDERSSSTPTAKPDLLYSDLKAAPLLALGTPLVALVAPEKMPRYASKGLAPVLN
jgi:hypothetical protein